MDNSTRADLLSFGVGLAGDIFKRTPAGIAYIIAKNIISSGITSADDVMAYIKGDESGKELLKALGGSATQALVGTAMDLLVPKTLSAAAKTGIGKKILTTAASRGADYVKQYKTGLAMINDGAELASKGNTAKANALIRDGVNLLSGDPQKAAGVKNLLVKATAKQSVPEAVRAQAVVAAQERLSALPEFAKNELKSISSDVKDKSSVYLNMMLKDQDEIASFVYDELSSIRNSILKNPDKITRADQLSILDPAFSNKMKGSNIVEGIDNIMENWIDPVYRKTTESAVTALKGEGSANKILAAGDIAKNLRRIGYRDSGMKKSIMPGLLPTAGMITAGPAGAAAGFGLGVAQKYLTDATTLSKIGYGLSNVPDALPTSIVALPLKNVARIESGGIVQDQIENYQKASTPSISEDDRIQQLIDQGLSDAQIDAKLSEEGY